jgi:hypothetical protein
MKKVLILVSTVILGLGTSSAAVAHPAKFAAKAPASTGNVPPQSITINGDVATPRTLKWPELAILPQQTMTVTIDGVTHVEKGPSLLDVIGLATPNIAACSRNDSLRWWIMVTNQSGQAAVFGRGEVDTGFGNHPAILSISEDGKFLTTAPQTLTFSQLQGMSQVGQTVSFLSGTTPTTTTEVGPRLADVVAKAAPNFKSGCPDDKLRWYVEITGSDGYASILSYSELDPSIGNRNPLVSLSENGVSLVNAGPRVVQNGDVRGRRLVSGSVALSVFRVAPRIPVAGC